MLTRRTATVTISAPETSMALRVSSKSLYLPVPTMSRERYSLPASLRQSGAAASEAWAVDWVMSLSAADEVDDLHLVAFLQLRVAVRIP